MENPALGAIASPYDYRDHIASAGVPALATAIALPTILHTDVGPVMMQSQEPACVSFSAVQVLKRWWFEKTGNWVDFSPRFLDTLVKRFDGQDRATAGTFPRMVFQLIQKYGCATTATVPNDTTLPVLQYRDDTILTPVAFAEALQYRIPGYVSVPNEFTATRNAIYLYGAISTLFQIGDELWTPSWLPQDINPLRPPMTTVSGHQMTPIGWVSDALNTLRNQWSGRWDRGGEGDYDPKAWQHFIIEQWAIAEIPQDVVDFLKNLPAPAAFHYQWTKDLTFGMQSDDVKFLQIALMILGYLGPIDPSSLGIYGPKTAAAVGKYQQANLISPVPTRCGPQTRGRLNAQFA